MKRLLLPAGTVCKRGGVPFALAYDTWIECHPENFEAISKGFVPDVSYGGQALERNQGVQASFEAMQAGAAKARAEFEAKKLADAPLTIQGFTDALANAVRELDPSILLTFKEDGDELQIFVIFNPDGGAKKSTYFIQAPAHFLHERGIAPHVRCIKQWMENERRPRMDDGEP